MFHRRKQRSTLHKSREHLALLTHHGNARTRQGTSIRSRESHPWLSTWKRASQTWLQTWPRAGHALPNLATNLEPCPILQARQLARPGARTSRRMPRRACPEPNRGELRAQVGVPRLRPGANFWSWVGSFILFSAPKVPSLQLGCTKLRVCVVLLCVAEGWVSWEHRRFEVVGAVVVRICFGNDVLAGASHEAEWREAGGCLCDRWSEFVRALGTWALQKALYGVLYSVCLWRFQPPCLVLFSYKFSPSTFCDFCAVDGWKRDWCWMEGLTLTIFIR